MRGMILHSLLGIEIGLQADRRKAHGASEADGKGQRGGMAVEPVLTDA